MKVMIESSFFDLMPKIKKPHGVVYFRTTLFMVNENEKVQACKRYAWTFYIRIKRNYIMIYLVNIFILGLTKNIINNTTIPYLKKIK